jgi:hypothetical protein
LARSSWSKRRRSRYLPFKPRPRAGVAVAPEATAPRFPFVVHVPSTLPAMPLGALEARQGRRFPGPAPDAGSRSRHRLSTRVSRRARSCLPSWAPRSPPLTRSTPPWTFGQGRTHASGWRYESRTDPPAGARPDLAADADGCRPRGGGHHNPPWLQKCTDGAGSHVSFLRPTELAAARAWRLRKPLGRPQRSVVACGAVNPDHPLQRATESALPVGFFPDSCPSSMRRSGGASQPHLEPATITNDNLTPAGRRSGARDPDASRMDQPSRRQELGGQVAAGDPGPLLRPGQADPLKVLDSADRAVQHSTRHSKDRLAQDPAERARFLRRFFRDLQAQGGVPGGARPAQPGAEAPARHGAGLAARAAGAGHHPDLPELPARAGAVDGQARASCASPSATA